MVRFLFLGKERVEGNCVSVPDLPEDHAKPGTAAAVAAGRASAVLM